MVFGSLVKGEAWICYSLFQSAAGMLSELASREVNRRADFTLK